MVAGSRTHFLPARECISPRFREDHTGLNDYFANNLGDWIFDLKDTTWMFGHTHDHVDLMIGDTRVVCNPRGYDGYEGQAENFTLKTVEI